MNINFTDKETVTITESFSWDGKRPEQKLILKKHQVVDAFKKAHKEWAIVSIKGPDSVSNFRTKEDSEGVWTLKVQKNIANKVVKKAKPQTLTAAVENSVNTKASNKPQIKKNKSPKQKEV